MDKWKLSALNEQLEFVEDYPVKERSRLAWQKEDITIVGSTIHKDIIYMMNIALSEEARENGIVGCDTQKFLSRSKRDGAEIDRLEIPFENCLYQSKINVLEDGSILVCGLYMENYNLETTHYCKGAYVMKIKADFTLEYIKHVDLTSEFRKEIGKPLESDSPGTWVNFSNVVDCHFEDDGRIKMILQNQHRNSSHYYDAGDIVVINIDAEGNFMEELISNITNADNITYSLTALQALSIDGETYLFGNLSSDGIAYQAEVLKITKDGTVIRAILLPEEKKTPLIAMKSVVENENSKILLLMLNKEGSKHVLSEVDLNLLFAE